MDARLRLGIGDNLLDAVLGYLVVFIGLSLLMLVIIIVGKVMVAKSKKADNKSTAPAAEPVSAAAPAAPEIVRPAAQTVLQRNKRSGWPMPSRSFRLKTKSSA